MINQFQKRGYNRSLIEQQIDKANVQGREQFLIEKKKTLPQLSLYQMNKKTPLNKEIVMKHWHLLYINPNLAKIFRNSPILAFHRNKNLRDLLISN